MSRNDFSKDGKYVVLRVSILCVLFGSVSYLLDAATQRVAQKLAASLQLRILCRLGLAVSVPDLGVDGGRLVATDSRKRPKANGRQHQSARVEAAKTHGRVSLSEGSEGQEAICQRQ